MAASMSQGYHAGRWRDRDRTSGQGAQHRAGRRRLACVMRRRPLATLLCVFAPLAVPASASATIVVTPPAVAGDPVTITGSPGADTVTLMDTSGEVRVLDQTGATIAVPLTPPLGPA